MTPRSRPLRVAQIAPVFESVPPKLYGGTERVVDTLSRGLVSVGADVTVFCSGDSTTSGTMRHIVPKSLRISRGSAFDPYCFQMRMLGEVAKVAEDFDIIHNHFDYPLMQLARATSVPVVTTMHNGLHKPADLALALEPFRDVPVVSISYAQRRAMRSLNWVQTVYHGIDPETFRLQTKPGKYLAFLGRLSRDKRPDWAIEIAQKSGIPLKIAAKIDETDEDFYHSELKPRIDGRFIEYIGEIGETEKSEFLGHALGLVFPIDWPEPFGLVMIEAMACGTPVLARPMGAAPEILREGHTGFLRVKIEDLANLVPMLASLDRLAIRREFEERFSTERMTQEYLNVYRKLIAQRDHLSWRGAAAGGTAALAAVNDEPAQLGRVAEHRRNFLYSVDGPAHRDPKGFT